MLDIKGYVNLRRFTTYLIISLLALAACTGDDGEEVAAVPTVTLQPLVTLTPRLTATPVITRTPLPTFTPIPSETLTPSVTPVPPTPTATPPITGIVGGPRRINLRAGPGTTHDTIGGLTPGTGILILGQNEDGTWLNILLDDGTEGWVSAGLIYIEPTATPFPTMTPTTDLTAVALGTTFPTAVFGGGTITPTPPRSVVSPTPADGTSAAVVATPVGSATATQPFLPVINVGAINQTATALAGGISEIEPPAPLTPAATGQSPNRPQPGITPQASSTLITPPPASGNATVQEDRPVFALCDNPALGGEPAPTDLAAGSSIVIYWGWIVADPSYIPQHEAAVSYEIAINGTPVSANWRQFGSPVRQTGSSHAKFWYLPAGTLEAGTYRITYRATWSEQISDGYELFGPGTNNFVEEGSCTFTVR